MKKKVPAVEKGQFEHEQQRKEAKAKEAERQAHLRLHQELGDNNTNQYRQ